MRNGCPTVKSISLLLLVAFLLSFSFINHHTRAQDAFKASRDQSMLSSGVLVSDRVLVSDGSFLSSGLLFLRSGVLVSDSVLASDGVLVSDGVLASDNVLGSESIARAMSATNKGDPTLDLNVTVDSGVDCLNY